MDEGTTIDTTRQWLIAGAISVALHAGVLALFGLSAAASSPRSANEPLPDETAEKVEKVEKVERVEKVEKVEKVERVEKDEGVERTEKVEKKTVKVEAEAKPKVEKKAETKPKVEEKAQVREPEKDTPKAAVETYVVKKGDMLTHIAQDCNTTIQELAKLNGTTVKKLSNLRVGQKIKIPRK